MAEATGGRLFTPGGLCTAECLMFWLRRSHLSRNHPSPQASNSSHLSSHACLRERSIAMSASRLFPHGHEIHVAPASARAFVARSGDYITVVDLEGQQIGDFVALNATDHKERLSTCHTRSALRRIYVREGDCLYTNSRRPLLEIVEDRVACHDILIPACDSAFYELRFGIAGHPNCFDNLAAALAEHAVEPREIPEPFNIFQNTRVDAEGYFMPRPALSRPGDRIVLRALMDLVGALSACAHDQAPVNGDKLTPLRLVIGPNCPEPAARR
jgi:uncharacterized protein